MALEDFRDSDTQSSMPVIWPLNEPGGILETLTSQNEDDLKSILSMAQFNTNLDSDVTNSTTLGSSSSSRSAIADVYLQSHGNTPMEPCISLPSYQMSLLSHNPVNNIYTDDVYSHLCQFRERDSKRQHLGNTIGSSNLHKRKVQTRRIDSNQEVIQEFLLKELQECNPQLKEMIKQYKQQMQIQQQILQPASNLTGFRLQIPKQQIQSSLQEQVNQQEIFAPLLDGALCSRRFKQYLYHLRNNKHDNDISYWRKFVSEYYAPGSKKRWCFSRYENIELHTAGVFCPKSMETWCCDLCGLKSGKGLEATSEIFPRLFKIKFESGMLDEILYLDSPRACKVSRGVVLEYMKVIQESVFETFRVVHKGKLRIVFGHDLKITSWEFCIENHDEYLLRNLFSPQVNLLDKAVEKYHDIQNRPSSRSSLQDLRKVCDMFVSAGSQMLENMDLPLVNDLGYPKRFIRCLQIGEVVDTMRDLMTFSHNANVGPIEGLNIYSQGIKAHNQMKGKQEMEHSMSAQNRSTGHANGPWMFDNSVISGSGLTFVNQLPGQLNSSTRRNEQSSIMDHSNQPMQSFNSYLYNEPLPLSSEKTRDQALFDKLIREMVGSSSRGKSVQETYDEVVQHSNNTSNESTAVILSHATLSTKPEPYSPEQLPETLQNSTAGFSRIEEFIGSFSGKTTY